MKRRLLLRAGLIAALSAAWTPILGQAQAPAANAIDAPPWFATTFLDFREDLAEASQAGKRLLVYFGQDGCPYCRRLMVDNFGQREIAAHARRHFVAIELNLWGNRETTWLDGKVRSEKELAAFLRVQFTPTILLLDERGGVVARLNGYYPPHRFAAALDYVAGRHETRRSLADHLAAAGREAASPTLHDAPFLMRPPLSLQRSSGGKPLAVLFETPFCADCDVLHRETFRREEVLSQLRQFDVARLRLGSPEQVVVPDGRTLAAEAWARELGIAYAPSIVLFDEQGREAIRVEASFRPFHIAGVFAYVASGAHRREPSFQRFLQERAEALRRQGRRVDLLE